MRAPIGDGTRSLEAQDLAKHRQVAHAACMRHDAGGALDRRPRYRRQPHEELDENKKVALAYPLTQFVDERGELVYKHVPLSSNHGLSNIEARFRHTTRNLRGSGNMVYEIGRASRRARV